MLWPTESKNLLALSSASTLLPSQVSEVAFNLREAEFFREKTYRIRGDET